MSNMLVIGKSLPANIELAKKITTTGRKVFFVTEDKSISFEEQNIFSSMWNVSSAISSHSLLINCENSLGSIDEVLVYFDVNKFCSQFEVDKIEEISKGFETMITSYYHFVSDLLRRIDQKKEKVSVMFLLKDYPSKYEMILSKNSAIVPCSTIVSVAKSAFISLAESFSTNVLEKSYLSVLLAKCSLNNEIYQNENEIFSWILNTFDSLKNQKNPQTIKQSTIWNKVGSKIQSGFSLFRI